MSITKNFALWYRDLVLLGGTYHLQRAAAGTSWVNSCKIRAKHGDKFFCNDLRPFYNPNFFFFFFFFSSSQAYCFYISYNTVGVEDFFGLLRRPHGRVESANWETRWATELHQSGSSSPLLFIFFVPSLFLPPPTPPPLTPPPPPSNL